MYGSIVTLVELHACQKVTKTQPKTLTDYVAHFSLPVQEVEQGRQSKVSTVHHNEQGRIIRID